MTSSTPGDSLTDEQLDAFDIFALYAWPQDGRTAVRKFARAIIAADRAVRPAPDEPTEPMFLVTAGDDGYSQQIVPQSKLNDTYLLTQFSSLDDVTAEERREVLDHFHDINEWNFHGGNEAIEFGINFEDGWVRVQRLTCLADRTPDASSQASQALGDMEARKDAAYLERNQVVAALAKCFPSGVARTAIEGWSEDWHGCVYIDLPTGQASWHFHDSQAYLFDGLPPYTGTWDGHDTPEKYRRLAALSPNSEGAEGARVAMGEAIIEQAQVFASAWSLVGGQFDDGSALENAEEAKEELHGMIRRLAASPPPQAEQPTWRQVPGQPEGVMVTGPLEVGNCLCSTLP